MNTSNVDARSSATDSLVCQPPHAAGRKRTGHNGHGALKRMGAWSAVAASLFFGLATLAHCAPTAQLTKPSDSETDDRVRLNVEETVRQAWKRGDFQAIEALSSDYHTLDQRAPSGKSLFSIYADMLLGMTYYPGSPEDAHAEFAGCECSPDPANYPIIHAEWNRMEAKLNAWIAKHPKSSTAHIVKAHYFERRANFFRGSGPVSTIHPEALPIMRENMTRAMEELRAAYALDEKNPLWYPTALSVLGAQGADLATQSGVLDKMIRNNQAYEIPFAKAMFYQQPKWGGSLQAMDSIARVADDVTAKHDLGASYARVYWNLTTFAPDLIPSFFKKTHADWPKMKQSFDAMVSQYPVARNFSGYALFACQAGDIALAKSLLAKAGSVKSFETAMRGKNRECEPDSMRVKDPYPYR